MRDIHSTGGEDRALEKVTVELVAVNRRLQEAEAFKGRFLSNIRNEIVNPLAGLLGLTENCMRDAGEGCRETARALHGEAFRLHFQLQNIFAAAELEAGVLTPSRGRVDLNALIREVLKEVGRLAGEKRLSFRMSLPEGLEVVSDAGLLHLVLANLLANSIEFSPDLRVVEVEAAREGEAVVVRVKDQGIGIDPEHLEEAFERFRQLDEGSTKAHRGQGLGLSVSRALAELLGGELELSTTRGQGCTATLSLAAAPAGEEGGDSLFLADNVQLF